VIPLFDKFPEDINPDKKKELLKEKLKEYVKGFVEHEYDLVTTLAQRQDGLDLEDIRY
jgi:hypothetical protein